MPSQMLGVRLTEREEQEMKNLVDAGLYISVSEFIRDSVRKNIASLKVVKIRDVSREKAKKEIIEFMKSHNEAYSSDLAEDLELDVEIVISIMKELNKEGLVE